MAVKGDLVNYGVDGKHIQQEFSFIGIRLFTMKEAQDLEVLTYILLFFPFSIILLYLFGATTKTLLIWLVLFVYVAIF